MRIVAGQAKGRKLFAPKGRHVRPTADQVREALFSLLGPRILNAQVLDLFAGTGALGLEALSRGAAHAVFVEKARQVRSVLERNILELGFEARSNVVLGDALEAISILERKKKLFDVIFLDPPYKGSLLSKALYAIGVSELLGSKAIIAAEHPSSCVPDLPKILRTVTTKSYGGTGLSIIEYQGSCEPRTKEKDNIWRL